MRSQQQAQKVYAELVQMLNLLAQHSQVQISSRNYTAKKLPYPFVPTIKLRHVEGDLLSDIEFAHKYILNSRRSHGNYQTQVTPAELVHQFVLHRKGSGLGAQDQRIIGGELTNPQLASVIMQMWPQPIEVDVAIAKAKQNA